MSLIYYLLMKNKDSEPNLLFQSKKIKIRHLKGLKLVELKIYIYIYIYIYISLSFTAKIKGSEITKAT